MPPVCLRLPSPNVSHAIPPLIDELFNTIPADAPAVDSVLAIDPVADMRAKAAAEKDRIAGIEKVCGDGHAEIAAPAMR